MKLKILLLILLLTVTPVLAEEIAPLEEAELQEIKQSNFDRIWHEVKTNYAPAIAQRVREIIKAPATNINMIWIVTPLLITLLVMTFYFGRYITEELGWNTAVGNSLVLLYTSMDLLRYIFNGVGVVGGFAAFDNFALDPLKTIIAIAVGCFGLFLMFSNFIHALPKKLAFFVSSPLPINLTAYLAIAITYTNIAFDYITIIAAIFIFICLYIIITFIKMVESQIFKEKIVEEQEEEPPEVTERLKELETEE